MLLLAVPIGISFKCASLNDCPTEVEATRASKLESDVNTSTTVDVSIATLDVVWLGFGNRLST